ncbi:transcription factor IIA subunit alpha [Coemansia nantahalensis]|nr:transcription factor IIA subunit alpha [Coemansia nantahalensis]
MSNSIVATIYRYVIDDVVHNVQADFEGHGVDTSVLEELQRSWEAKIVQSRVASFPDDDVAAIDAYGQPAPFHQHGGSGGGGGPDSGGYAAYHYSHHPQHHHHQHYLQHHPHHHQAEQPRQYAGATEAAGVNSAASLASIINPESMAPSAASLASLAQSGRGQLLEDDDDDNAVAGMGGGGGAAPGRRYGGPPSNVPQHDGAADAVPAPRPQPRDAMAEWRALRDERIRAYKLAAAVPQVDGVSDDEDDEDDDDASGRGAAGVKDGPVEAAEDAINSDLDDSDEEEDNENNEDSAHIILCQYEKVSRSKNKWKCVLRDGIMLINGRDYLFQKANGDFEW